MVTIKLKVKGQELKIIDGKEFVATSDTINYFRCRATFAEDWDIYTDRTIYFKNISSGICRAGVLNDDGYCFIPWEVLANTGVIVANAVGIIMDGNTVSERLITFPVTLFVQVEEGQITVQPNEDPSPTQYEQFIANVQSYAESALTAKFDAENSAIRSEASAGSAVSAKLSAIGASNSARSSASSANSSAYNAEVSAKKVEDMTVSAVTLEEYDEVRVTKTETQDSYNLEFGIPKGPTGDPRTWSTLEDKPTVFPPAAHTHSDLEGSISSLDSDIDELLRYISEVQNKIPSQASSSNQLADKDFVNSSISTNTANFKGTYDSVTQIEAISDPTNNDYAFLVVYDTSEPTQVDHYDRYKYDGSQWTYEYTLNNSSFTAAQWESINSGITSSLVSLIGTAAQLSALAKVAISGSYSDLSNKPVNVSAFNNDVGYLTSAGILSDYRTASEQDVIDSSKANLNHTQAADSITAGTFGGKVVANETSSAVITDRQIRNITISNAVPSESEGSDGDIWLVYNTTE